PGTMVASTLNPSLNHYHCERFLALAFLGQGGARGDPSALLDEVSQMYLSRRRGVVKRALRVGVFLSAAWVGVAGLCVLGGVAIDCIAGPPFHRKHYAVAESLLSAKLALCEIGSWLFVPGQQRELRRSAQMLADLRREREQGPSASADAH